MYIPLADFWHPDPDSIPTKPSMHIIDINLIGVMYSLKLAIHYFRASPIAAERDRCFIFGGSIAGYADNLVSAACLQESTARSTYALDRVAGSTRPPSSASAV